MESPKEGTQREKREDIHPLLYSKTERRKTDQDLEIRQWRVGDDFRVQGTEHFHQLIGRS